MPGVFPGDPEINLNASLGHNDPGEVTLVSYAAWRELRRSVQSRHGLIMRDDSVLGEYHIAAPADDPRDIPEEWAINAILNPKEWIDSRDEAQIRADIDAIQEASSLRRLLRAVDDELRRLQSGYEDRGTPAGATRALRELSAKYQMVDQLVTSRLESIDVAPGDRALGQSDLTLVEFPRRRHMR
jgi:hypothetical protein